MHVWILLKVCEADDTQSIQLFHDSSMAATAFEELRAEVEEDGVDEASEAIGVVMPEFRSAHFPDSEIYITLSLEHVQ